MADPAGSFVRFIRDIFLDGMGHPEPVPPFRVREAEGAFAKEPSQAVVADLAVAKDPAHLLV
jgi:hypothetical protein